MPGLRVTEGADLRVPAGGLAIRLARDGTPELDRFVPQLRTDMWPFWLEEAIDAAVRAKEHASAVAALASQGDEDALTRAMVQELRAAMRAITACAFAIDGFYAAIKARAGEHPDQETWLQVKANGRRTPRHTQVFETLRYHLKMRNPTAAEVKAWIRDLFRFRGWAVHPGSRFREPVFRSDIDADVDWHFVAFRSDNAVNAVKGSVNVLDVLVAHMPRGTEELRRHHLAARRAMNLVLDLYDEAGLPGVERVDDPLPGNP